MPGFSSRDDLINEITVNGKQDLWNFYKIAPATAEAAGVWQTLWKGAGQPGAGSDAATTPGTVYDTDAGASTAGAIWFPDRSADLRYLLSFGACASQDCTLMLYDRLASVSGVLLTTTGNKTVNSGALTRYSGTDAILNEVWLEVTAATTVTAPVVDLNQYTSADGTSTSGGNVTFPSAATDAQTMIQMPLNNSKQGVRSVEVGLHVTTAATAGTVSVTIIRPLARVGLKAALWNEVNFLDDTMGLPRIFDNATLGLALLASTTTAVQVSGLINCAYG